MPQEQPSHSGGHRSAPVPLTSVPAGATVTLDEIRHSDSRDTLRSLGIIDASRLRLCQAGDPCIVQVRATRIGLSRAVAQDLYVLTDSSRG